MHLLKIEADHDLSLVEYVESEIPEYAILSHTWGKDEDEVTYNDLLDVASRSKSKSKAGWQKITFCARQAALDGLYYFWIDTCCIDKSSSAVLTEAINSMFRWYSRATKCYVYLSDVTAEDSTIQHSRWFTRGWTLQELLAPQSLYFFNVDGKMLGSKTSMAQELHVITGISLEALQGTSLSDFSVDDRFSWAATRQTKREEDAAYSLLGIFDIHMPLIYGEGREKALARLRRKIDKLRNQSYEATGERPAVQSICRSEANVSTQALASSAKTRPDSLRVLSSLASKEMADFIEHLYMLLPFFLYIQTLARQIPSAMSNLLPDNITLQDILGRKHSLSIAYFANWGTLTAMLRFQLQGCPGHDYVSKGSFTIIDVNDFGRRVGPSNWQTVISKRKKFTMLVNLSETKMINGTCARCGDRVRKQGEYAGFCRSCGLFCKRSNGVSNSSIARDLRKARYKQRYLAPTDHRGLRYVEQCIVAVQEHRRLADELERLAIAHGFRAKDTGPVRERVVLGVADSHSQVESGRQTGEHGDPVEAGAVDDEREDEEAVDGRTGDSDSEESTEADPEMSECRDKRRELERRELRHFTSIYIKQDSSLHDAAYSGDLSSIQELLSSGHQVDENWGQWGTPLIAAVVSVSDEAVRMLLKARADPLLAAGPLGCPLNAACLAGQASTFEIILNAMIARGFASDRRSLMFQDAIDQALFTCMNVSFHGPTVILLYLGANPYRRLPDGRSAFAIALNRKDGPLTNLLLAEAWGRGLLAPEETICLWWAVAGNELREADARDSWLRSCCSNILMGRSKMLEDRIAARLRARKTRFHRLEPEWRCSRESRTVGMEYMDGFGEDRTRVRSSRGPMLMVNSRPVKG